MLKIRRFAVVLALVPTIAPAQPLAMDEPLASMDTFRGVIMQIGQTQNGWTVCFGKEESLGTVRVGAEAELQARGVEGLPTPRQLITALRGRYPCPFSPLHAKARPATANDLEGSWSMPETSAVLRFPPHSPQRKSQADDQRVMPFRCLAIGYFAAGEARHVELRGTEARCFGRESDFAIARSMPRAVSWSTGAPGKLTLTRSDIPGHVEQWDVFVIETPFAIAGVTFQPGDLIQYLRKYPGPDTDGYAIEFRHLKRLP